MTDEIKKLTDILNYYKTIQKEPVYCEELITTEELQRLLDYITNLQEGNKDLYNKLSKLLGRMSKLINYINDRIEDINNGGNEKEYKSIIYIKELIEKGEDNGNDN